MAWHDAELQLNKIPMKRVSQRPFTGVQSLDQHWTRSDHVFLLDPESMPWWVDAWKLATLAMSGSQSQPRYVLFKLDEYGNLANWARADRTKIQREWPDAYVNEILHPDTRAKSGR